MKFSSDQFYKLLSKITGFLSQFAEAFIKSYLNTQIGQGVLKRVIDFTVEKLFDEVVDPVLKVALVKIGYRYDVHQGKRLIEKLHRAEEEGNAEDYDNTTDVILGGNKRV